MPTILLVEDDAVLRGGLTEGFVREGYGVISIASVKEAREKLSTNVKLVVEYVMNENGFQDVYVRPRKLEDERRPANWSPVRAGEV